MAPTFSQPIKAKKQTYITPYEVNTKEGTARGWNLSNISLSQNNHYGDKYGDNACINYGTGSIINNQGGQINGSFNTNSNPRQKNQGEYGPRSQQRYRSDYSGLKGNYDVRYNNHRCRRA